MERYVAFLRGMNLGGRGISESDLDLKAIDAALGEGTMRTRGTIEQIAAKHCAG